MWNILINGVCFGVLYELVQVWQFDFDFVDRSLLTTGLLVLSLPLLILAIILSMILMFMEKYYGCCCLRVACCNIRDQIRQSLSSR